MSLRAENAHPGGEAYVLFPPVHEKTVLLSHPTEFFLYLKGPKNPMKILLKLKTNLHFFLIFTLKLVSWEYKFNLTKFNTFSFKYMKKTLKLFISSQPS